MKKLSFLISMVLLFGCHSKDSDIKESIAVNAKEKLMFAGVNYSVANGVVTLTGNSPSEELKEKLIKQIQSTGGVKKVVDKVLVGPVVLDSDFVLKQKVDSVLANYAQVEAEVKNGVVSLSGEVSKSRERELMQDIHQLPITGIESRLELK